MNKMLPICIITIIIISIGNNSHSTVILSIIIHTLIIIITGVVSHQYRHQCSYHYSNL